MNPVDHSPLSVGWDAIAKIGALMLAAAKSGAELWTARKAQEVRLGQPQIPDSYLVNYGITVFNRSSHVLTVMDIGFWKYRWKIGRFGWGKVRVEWKAPNLHPVDIPPKSQKRIEPDNLTIRSVVVNALKKDQFDGVGMWITTGAGDHYYSKFASSEGPVTPSSWAWPTSS